jgi:hypothetical protein
VIQWWSAEVKRLRTAAVEDTEKYQVYWRTHIEGMENNRQPKKALLHKPQEEEMLGGLEKRWSDQF